MKVARRAIESASTVWSEFLTALHINLHLPRTWGIFLVGLTGVALLSSLISGLFAHPRIFRDAFHLRLGGSRRLQEADLHNRIGVWALPFHVLVSLTGALLGLTTIIVGVLGLAVFQGDVDRVYSLFLPPHPADDPRPAPLMDLRPMFAEVARLSPEGRIEYVFLEHPTERGGAALFNDKDLVAKYRWYPAQLEALNVAQARPRISQWARVETILGDYLQLALIGQMQPKQALSEANAQIARALSR